MKNELKIKKHFMQDAPQLRLGGLAANFDRIRSFSNNYKNISSVEGLIDENKYLIEWTTADVSPSSQ